MQLVIRVSLSVFLLALLSYAGYSQTSLPLLGVGTGGGATHQVVLDSCATHVNQASNTSYTGTLQTVGTGTNRALVILANWVTASGAVSAVSAAWDSSGTNQTVGQLGLLNSNTLTTAIFGLVAPTSGNKTLSMTWTNAAEMYMVTCAWTGVNQTGSTTSFPGIQTSTAAVTVTVTSAVGDIVVGTEIIGSSFASTTGTNIYIDNAGTAAGAAQYQAGAATVATGSNASTLTSGIDIKAN